MLTARCNDCGVQVAVVAPEISDTGALVEVFTGTPRCSTCGRRHHGLPY